MHGARVAALAKQGEHDVRDLIETDQRETVAVGISKAGEDATPNRRMIFGLRRRLSRTRCAHGHRILEALQTRREGKAHAARAPFTELGENIFGDKSDLRGPANELVLLGIALRDGERQVRGTVGRRDGYKTAAGKFFIASVEDQLESKLVHVETQAAVQIANVDGYGLKPQIRILAIQANRGAVNPFLRRVCHEQALYARRNQGVSRRNIA